MNDVLESGYYESPLRYDNVDWFVKEVILLENKMTLYFKETKKDFIMSKKMKKILKTIIFVDFVKKKLFLIKLEIIVT